MRFWNETDRTRHHHVHAVQSSARGDLESARPLMMSGLTRIPDLRQASSHVPKVPTAERQLAIERGAK
jgi:hypothetical protein